MAYRDFTLDSAIKTFELAMIQDLNIFAGVPDQSVGDSLRAVLDENVELATDIHTEKARSELIVVPILLDIRRRMGR